MADQPNPTANPDPSAALAASAAPLPDNALSSGFTAPEGGDLAAPAPDADVAAAFNASMKRLAEGTVEHDEPKPKEGDAAGATGAPDAEKKAGEGDAPDAAAAAAQAQQAEKDAAKAAGDDKFKDIESVEISPHAHRDTKKAVQALKQIAKTEREQKAALEAKIAEYSAREAELAKRGDELPASAKARLEQLEQQLIEANARVREVDILADPQFRAKYETPIKSAKEAINALLSKPEHALGGEYDDKGNFTAPTTESLKAVLLKIEKDGHSPAVLAQYINQFERAGRFDEAETLRFNLRTIIASEQARESEIADWRKNAEARQVERKTAAEREATQGAERMHKSFLQSLQDGDRTFSSKLPFLAEPAAPSDKDAADVRSAKQKAVSAFTDARTSAAEQLNALFADLADPTKAPEANGKIRALAARALMLERWGVPQILSQLETAKTRADAASKEVAAVRKAGSLNAGAVPPTRQQQKQPDKIDNANDMAAVMKRIAEEQGISLPEL